MFGFLGPVPTDQSEVRLAFPNHTYVTKIKRKFEGQFDSEDSDEEFSSAEEEGENEDGANDEEDGNEEMEVADGSYLEQIKNSVDDEDGDDKNDDEERFYVYHSVKNTREDHMMTSEPKEVCLSVLVFEYALY